MSRPHMQRQAPASLLRERPGPEPLRSRSVSRRSVCRSCPTTRSSNVPLSRARLHHGQGRRSERLDRSQPSRLSEWQGPLRTGKRSPERQLQAIWLLTRVRRQEAPTTRRYRPPRSVRPERRCRQPCRPCAGRVVCGTGQLRRAQLSWQEPTGTRRPWFGRSARPCR